MAAKVRAQHPGHTALAVALLFGSALGTNVLAASNPVVIDRDVTQDLQRSPGSAENSSSKLPNRSPAKVSADISASLELADSSTGLQIVAPVLTLTPRVANLLDQIFATNGKPAEAAAIESSSPLAEQQTNRKSLPYAAGKTPSLLPQTTANGELPRLQRRMYRTDI